MNERASRLLFAWLPALLYMALIWVMSSLPHPPISLEDLPFRDKGVHFIEYGVLAALLAHALRGTFPHLARAQLYLAAVGGTALWGLLDEIHQAFVPPRDADLDDLVADVCGALFGAAVYLVLVPRILRFFRSRRAART